MKFEIKDYEDIDDYSLFLVMLSSMVTLDEKRYFIENCYDRLDAMKEDVFLQMMRQFEETDVLGLSEYICNKIKSFSSEQLEKTLYVNKYYHELSDLSDYLCSKDWFCNDKKSTNFCLGHRLEKLLKEEFVSTNELKKIGNNILDELIVAEHDVELSDLILKNYMSLLEKNAPEIIDDFISCGYLIIDKWLDEKIEVTPNIIIFLCHALKKDLKLDNFTEFFEFSNNQDADYFAYFHVNKINVNLACVHSCYEMFNDTDVAFQYLLFVLGHELGHAYVQEYKYSMERIDLKEELLIHNSCVSEALQNLKTKEFYMEYHDCFAHEFYANLNGIETLYSQQKKISALSKESKEEINRLLVCKLFLSYAMDSETGLYLGSVDFVRRFFDEYKDDLPEFINYILLNKRAELTEEFVESEEKLDDMERFRLGYHNKYIGILEMIANGDIKTINIFEDLPNLHLKYGHLVENKFPVCSQELVSEKKM